MSNIEFILLTYKNEYKMEYQYYAEFLRFIGIYVCENLEDDEDNFIENNNEQCFFKYTVSEIKDFDKRYVRVKYLKEMLKRLFEISNIPVWMNKLISIYEGYGLLQASVTLQYFRVGHQELVLNAGKQFEKVADKFVLWVQEEPVLCSENKYIRYAKLYSKQKVNLAQYLYDESCVYYVDNLALEGVGILKDFPDFSNIWILMGFIYESSRNFMRDAIDAYQRSIELIQDKPYVASVYYWLGRMCERDTTMKQLSESSYKKAYDKVKKYRNMYKVARISYDEKEWEHAIGLFKSCLDKIKQKGKYLDPLEQEYYFKVYTQISSSYLKLNDYRNTIIYAMKAIQFRQEIIEGKTIQNEQTKFYYDMYGNDAQKYIELEIYIMEPQVTYYNIAVACQESGLKDDADVYWQLYKERL